MAKNPSSRKTLEEIPDLDSLPEVDPNKPSTDKRPKRQPGFYWRGKGYKDKDSLVKAVRDELKRTIRQELGRPIDVVERDGTVWATKLRLVRLELQLNER